MARIGVIRSDVGRLLINDVDPVVQWSPSTEPKGQERYIHRPDPLVATNTKYSIAAALAADSNNLTALQVSATAPLILARGVPLAGSINVTASNMNFNYSGVDANAFNFAAHNMDTATLAKIAEEMAPTLIETSLFMLSFDHGVIGGLMSVNFTVKGAAGAAVDLVADDGTTPYSLP